MANQLFNPSVWSKKIIDAMTHNPHNISKGPVLPDEIQALLNLVSAQWQWSQFSMAWLVNFPNGQGGHHAVLVCPDKVDTLEQWTDICVQVKQQMEEELRQVPP